MKTVKTTQALGMMLAHDHTRIVGTEFKGVAFKKGHIIQKEDIPALLDMGKNSIYVLELNDKTLHENDAAHILAQAISGENIRLGEAKEGKVSLYSTVRGLLSIDKNLLTKINMLPNLAISSIHAGFMVEENQCIASAKIIPLTLQKAILERKIFQKIKADKTAIISVKKLPNLKVGLIVTGSEVYYKRIEDRFSSVLKGKVEALGSKIEEVVYLPDDRKAISEKIESMSKQYDMVLTSGGMSVDPDDVTSYAIRKVSTKVITYGTPVLPGAMFMLAYRDKTPILGVPACGMFSKVTVLDVILPRVIANENVTKKSIASLGYGGLCQGCPICTFPNCSFAK